MVVPCERVPFAVVFFGMPSVLLLVLLVAVVGGATAGGVSVGRVLHREREHESFGVVQGALLGLVGLLLAFGLSMAVGRYDQRRAVLVAEANSIGTTYLRAELLGEPGAASLELIREYTDRAIDLAESVPTRSFEQASTEMDRLQREIWALVGDAVAADPRAPGRSCTSRR
ncbi:MAG: hypothetical protein R2713_10655 [Ilumatobacteraceae bacterium]